MKKQIKLLIIIPLLICFTNETYSQKSREKTIIYGDGYNVINTANGYVVKKKFVENQNLTFRTERDLQDGRILRDTIVSGRYFTKDGNSYIDGIWKEWSRDFNKLVRVKGVFKVSNNENGIGITTNKKEGKRLIIYTLSNNQYHINILYNYYSSARLVSSFSLKSNITNLKGKQLYSNTFHEQILNDKKVEFSFKNGDVFIGSVKKENRNYNGFYYNIVPHIGEYKYKNEDIINGEIYYYNFFGGRLKFFPEENSYTVFKDGTIEEGKWVRKYFLSLNNDEEEDLYKNCKSLTELREKSIIIIDKKNKKTEEKEKEKEKAKLEELQKQIKRKKELSTKYGDYYGNKISSGELIPGMNKDMVNEVWKKEFFNISNIVRDGKMIEIWEFNKQKMQSEIIKEGIKDKDGDSAVAELIVTELSEQLVGLKVPKMLVFKNNKLTDIYR